MPDTFDADFVIIGSGFGGSVSALRLVQKGYRVLVLEKGRRLGAADFPETNWDLKRWLWMPQLGMRGLFKMTFLRHVTALSGFALTPDKQLLAFSVFTNNANAPSANARTFVDELVTLFVK